MICFATIILECVNCSQNISPDSIEHVFQAPWCHVAIKLLTWAPGYDEAMLRMLGER